MGLRGSIFCLTHRLRRAVGKRRMISTFAAVEVSIPRSAANECTQRSPADWPGFGVWELNVALLEANAELDGDVCRSVAVCRIGVCAGIGAAGVSWSSVGRRG